MHLLLEKQCGCDLALRLCHNAAGWLQTPKATNFLLNLNKSPDLFQTNVAQITQLRITNPEIHLSLSMIRTNNPNEYARTYRKIIWAYVFILFDFTIKINRFKFDIIGDWIGFIILASASLSMVHQNKKFKTLFIISIILAIINFANVFPDSRLLLTPSGNNSGNGLQIIFMLLFITFALTNDYLLFKGTENEALLLNCPEMAEHAKRLWKIYVALIVLALIIASAAIFDSRNTAAIPLFLGLLLIIIAQFSIILKLCKRAAALFPNAYVNAGNHSLN